MAWQRWLGWRRRARCARSGRCPSGRAEDDGDRSHRPQAALERGDVPAICQLMDANFAMRRKMYGDATLGACVRRAGSGPEV